MSKSFASASSAAPVRRRSLTAQLGVLGAITAVTVVALAISGIRQPALAQVETINPLEPALGFNAFIEGDTVLTQHEMEGPLATGGNLAMQGLYGIDIQNNASFVDGNDPLPSSLVVGGQMDWDGSTDAGNARVLGNGYVKVGDLTGTDVLTTDANNAPRQTRLVPSGSGYDTTPRVETVVMQPEDTVQSSPIDFEAAFSEMRTTSDDLAACANTVTMFDSREGGSEVAKGEVQPGQQIFITLTEDQTNVLNVTGEDLNNMSDLTFINPPTVDTPLLINVDTSGTDGVFDWDVATQAGIGDDQAPYILWNFSGTTELTLVGGDTVQGSIYAPDADFTDLSPTNVQGQIVAKSAVLGTIAVNSGELHYDPFAAELTCDTDVDPSPSPTTDGPTTDEPTTDEPTTDEPTTDEPTTDQPTSETPSSTAPTGEAPDSEGPGDSDQPGGMLPTTGSSLLPLGIAAGVLLAAGTAVLILSRRRRRLQ